MMVSSFSTGNLKAALQKMGTEFLKLVETLGLTDFHGPFKLQSSSKKV